MFRLNNWVPFGLFVAVFFIFGQLCVGQVISCSSDDGHRHRCSADTRQGVQLIKQRSESPCTQGYSWGYDRRRIWVDHGCRADFALGNYRGDDRSWDDDRGWGRGESLINCSSDDGRRRYCPTDTSGGVRMIQQRSESECRRGSSWGYDDQGIWVDRGCRADFEVGRRWEGHRYRDEYDRDDRDRGQGAIVACSSDDGRRQYCATEVRWGVSLIKQRSESECRFGYSWGYDRQGIWVDRGCRADFQVGR